jgi:hypothetical protein
MVRKVAIAIAALGLAAGVSEFGTAAQAQGCRLA